MTPPTHTDRIAPPSASRDGALTPPPVREMGKLTHAVREALRSDDLDHRLEREGSIVLPLTDALPELLERAFVADEEDALDDVHRALHAIVSEGVGTPGAHRGNEHHPVIVAARDRIDEAFEASLARTPLPEEPPADVDAFATWLADLALEREVHPPSGMGEYLRRHASLEEMREIVAQRSLFFLREPDPWIQALPTLHGPAKAGLIDLLLDEYGWGRLEHLHSTIYAELMQRLGLDTTPEAYADSVAWPFLAILNYQAMVGHRHRLTARLYGYIYLLEADSPASMEGYLAAWHRLGIDDPKILRFYELHAEADEGHRDLALHEVVVPVVRDHPELAPDIARGVLEGRLLHHRFSAHLATAFSEGRSSLRRPLAA